LPERVADGSRTADRRRRALARVELYAREGKNDDRDDVGLTWARPQGLKHEARPGGGAPRRRHGKPECAVGAWRGSTRLPACLHPAYGTATGGVSAVRPWVHSDELDVRTPDSLVVATWAVRPDCPRARARCRRRSAPVPVSRTRFQNYKTPKSVN
jgi:hypothetical protein